jgi:phosphoribosyl-AMP cyclohydrolase / phosphoribosyl-ATP pyrophosphohydrolase
MSSENEVARGLVPRSPLHLGEAAGTAGEGSVGGDVLPAAVSLSLDGLDELKFGPDGVISAIAQDLHTREVLIPGYATREMVQKTLETGLAWFWSRSRQQPWLKGAESGNYIYVREVRRNCYDNSVLYLGEPVGPACHTGQVGCYYRRLDGTEVRLAPSYDAAASAEPPADTRHLAPGSLDWVWSVIQQRLRDRPEGSYPVKLMDQGVDRIAKKVGEEAAEVIIAAKNRSKDELATEMADLWFHSLLVLADAGMTPEDVYRTLALRHTAAPKGAAS